MNKTENKKKEDILKKAKKIVSVEGWSSEILSKLQKQNLEKNDLLYFFPDGYKDLLEYALQDINEKLENKLKKIKYSGFDIDGKVIENEVEGLHARVVQHEVDHLNGILYTSRLAHKNAFGFEKEITTYWKNEQNRK